MASTSLAAAFPRALQSQPQPSPLQPGPDETDLLSSGFFLQLGFSFIVGLAVGYALKVAFKIAVAVGGLLLVLLFSLQYKGIIEVDWAGMESNYDSLVDWLTAYATGLKGFVADHLASAASFTSGLLLGMRL
jgi:uncharacterized membrane protein (Fun14 family)